MKDFHLPGHRTYLDQETTVIYAAKDGEDTKVFPALDWLVNLCSHIHAQGERLVRRYGLCNTIVNYSSIGDAHFNSEPEVEDSVGASKSGYH